MVLSDGELQEGSTWEAVLAISSLNLNNVIVVIDNNDYQSLEKHQSPIRISIQLKKNLKILVGTPLNVMGIMQMRYIN